jgi:hypothetical protein
MEDNEKNEELKHYTRLTSLINILEKKQLWLCDPENWPDRNDRAAVLAYKKKKGADDVRVLCLAKSIEMVHHWFFYAKEDGCCITLDSKEFLDRVEKSGYLHDTVEYIPREGISREKLKALEDDKIPFIKRRPFECENEYRIIWTGKKPESTQSISIEDCIVNITLSPLIDEKVADAVQDMLKNKYGLKIQRSRLLKSDEWISLFDRL